MARDEIAFAFPHRNQRAYGALGLIGGMELVCVSHSESEEAFRARIKRDHPGAELSFVRELPKDCGCLDRIHLGPHWLHEDALDREQTRKQIAARNPLAVPQMEIARLERKKVFINRSANWLCAQADADGVPQPKRRERWQYRGHEIYVDKVYGDHVILAASESFVGPERLCGRETSLEKARDRIDELIDGEEFSTRETRE